MKNNNLEFGDNNRLGIYGVKKQLVHPFRKKWFCKCVGFILSAVTYRKKLHKICGKTPIYILVRRHKSHEIN